MKYDFDKIINRKGSFCAKWDELEEKFGRKDLLPLWVADMDFQSPKPVIDAIIDRAKHGIYGYTSRPSIYYDSIVNWIEKRYNWNIKKNWITFSPGVLPAISFAIQNFTIPGDQIIIQPPVYYQFYEIIKNNGRNIIKNSLYLKKGRYYMDFSDLKNKAMEPRVKMMILCNPHNPVGRVWQKEELLELGEICYKNGILVVSDEIHSDIVLGKNIYYPFAKLSKENLSNSITCISPSKTFNLAGLQTSAIIIPQKNILKDYNVALNANRVMRNNFFGLISLMAAYNYGEEWLNQLLKYLNNNLYFLINYIEKNIPLIKVIKPEGTYLVWLDCRKLNMNHTELEEFFINKARVALDGGHWFGSEGRGFMRINIATPMNVLNDALERIKVAIRNL
jgi:cysteine-S-conjugate beta-lyase